MVIGSKEPYHAKPPITPTILPALRELFSQHPNLANCGPEELRELLGRYLPWRPGIFEIEAALEALRVEGQVVA
jgi:hypothetical protein